MPSKVKIPKDYLKYLRVVEYWAKKKWNINQADLDLMLFLHSEKYFGRKDIEEFCAVSAYFDSRILERLMKEGWIDKFRTHYKKQKALYRLSYKASRMVDSIYAVLNGEEVPMDPRRNPLFRARISTTDKKYREAIKRMNAHIREMRVEVKEANLLKRAEERNQEEFDEQDLDAQD